MLSGVKSSQYFMFSHSSMHTIFSKDVQHDSDIYLPSMMDIE